jgi:uncharacterized protein YkwD
MPMLACARRRAGARPTSRASRCTAAAALLAAAAAIAPAAPAHAAGNACAAAAVAPGAAPNARLRRALRCLINAERARHGLRRLRASRHLGAAARRHASDMVARDYFAHDRPGSTLAGRVRAAGWTGAEAAEALSWGCGGRGAARAVLDGWLASPEHRAIVLGPYKRAGVGLAIGTPVGLACSGAGTWVLDVG